MAGARGAAAPDMLRIGDFLFRWRSYLPWVAPIAVTVLAIVYYACIAWREEQFLRERFGSAFGSWAARVMLNVAPDT